MIRKGSKFQITKRSHWAYGKVFTCKDIPDEFRIKGNPDMPDLVWNYPELVEYEAYMQNRWQAYLIRADWCREVSDGEK